MATSTSALVEFENALLVDRVATRFAMEHDSPEALKKYLQDHPDADKSKHSVKPAERERGSADKDEKAEAKGKGADKPKKPPTFQKAREALQDHLKSKGWKMSNPGLKVQHATSDDGRVRVWFKPQAVYYSVSDHGRHDLGAARSIHTDIRHADPEKVVEEVKRYAK